MAFFLAASNSTASAACFAFKSESASFAFSRNWVTSTPSSAADDTTSLSSVAFSALSKTLVSKVAAPPSAPPDSTALSTRTFKSSALSALFKMESRSEPPPLS